MTTITEPAPSGPPNAAPEYGDVPTAATPWRLVGRRVRHSRAAMVAVLVLVLIIGSAIAAPLWADHVAHTGPYRNHLTDSIKIGGEDKLVVDYDGIPIGPTFHGRFFLGADGNGRDVMVRLLYASRASLYIGLVSTLISLLVGSILGVLSGYYRGFVDTVIARALDLLWAFPVILLGVALGVATAAGGLNFGLFKVNGGSLLLVSFIIGVVNVVYIARPVRGVVFSLRERAFVEAARAQGAGNLTIMRREILPNLVTTLLVLAPIVVSQTVALEAALSFLGAGVQPPQPSWGTMIGEGNKVLISAPHLTIVPGILLVATVLSLNILGDVIREALDPRGTLRAETETR